VRSLPECCSRTWANGSPVCQEALAQGSRVSHCGTLLSLRRCPLHKQWRERNEETSL
jgi:hypothetical protein